MEVFVNLEEQEKINKLKLFDDLEKVKNMYNDYEEAFSKIGINTKTDVGTNRDLLEVLTDIARQLYEIQLRLYDLERK